MAEDNAAASVSPDTATAAATATPAANAETTKPEGAQATDGEGQAEAKTATAGSDDADAAKATEAAKALAARKQTANERINELTRARRDAERQRDAALKEAADLRAKAIKPDPAKYDDVSELSAAQLAHQLDSREADRKTAAAERASKEAEAADIEAWQERISVFKETALDFDEVALKAPITDAVAKDILRIEEGPQIAYYLGKHPAEARALNILSERDRAIQLGRLAGRLTQAPIRKTSTAPTPVDAVGGKGSQSSAFDPSKASMDDYIARRKAGWRG